MSDISYKAKLHHKTKCSGCQQTINGFASAKYWFWEYINQD